MSKLTIVSKIRINGELYLQEEVDSKEFQEMAEKKVIKVMEGIGFKKDKTA